MIWDISDLYPTKIVLSVDTFLTEIRLFQSLYHQEGNLKVRLLIKNMYQIVPNAFFTLTLGCRVQYLSGRAGALLDAISFHHNCNVGKIIQYFCNASFSQLVFVMLFRIQLKYTFLQHLIQYTFSNHKHTLIIKP